MALEGHQRRACTLLHNYLSPPFPFAPDPAVRHHAPTCPRNSGMACACRHCVKAARKAPPQGARRDVWVLRASVLGVKRIPSRSSRAPRLRWRSYTAQTHPHRRARVARESHASRPRSSLTATGVPRIQGERETLPLRPLFPNLLVKSKKS